MQRGASNTYPHKAALNNRSRYFSTKSTCYWSFMANLEKKTTKSWHVWVHLNIRNMPFGILHTRSLPVFLTDASTVSLSHGSNVFRSMSSQEIPSYNMLYTNSNPNNMESIKFFKLSECCFCMWHHHLQRNFKFDCFCYLDGSIETKTN